jgi:hypothetical protein
MLLHLEDKLMLTKLLPDQIAKFWSVIKFAVEQSLPPIVGEHPDRMNRILSSALSGGVDVWASYTRNEEVVKFEGIALTKILYDDVSITKNLLIYCFYGYTNVNSDSWLEGLKSLLKYAKRMECSFVTAYTDIPHVVEIASKLGADVKYRFISFEVKK